MKTSPFQAVLFGIFGLGALIGLFVFATYTSTNDPESVGMVVIWGTLPSAGIQATLSALSTEDPSFESVSYEERNARTLSSDLATAIATNTGPDLIIASHEQLHALSKFLTPIPFETLPARTFESSFIAGARIFTAPGGAGYLGVPFLVDPLVLFFHRPILSSSGVVEPPAHWESLVGLVPTVAQLTPSRQILRGLVALGTYDNVENARGILSALFIQQGVPLGGYTESGVRAANLGSGSGGLAPGPAVMSFYTQFADPAKVSYTWNASLPNSRQKFLAGDLALYFGYLSEARLLRTANPNLDFGISALPQPANASLLSGYGLLYAHVLPRGAKNIAGAYQVATRLAGAAEQTLAARSTGLAPVALASLSAPQSDPVATLGYAVALYVTGWLSPAPADTDTVFSSMIGNVISGRSTIQSALNSAEQALTALLQR
jgi:ABC-type glycerol-3-phosphate transport system substrate-binding protein